MDTIDENAQAEPQVDEFDLAFNDASADPTDAPVADAPVADAPVADAPAADAPVADAPAAETPAADAPIADAPVADAPAAVAPTQPEAPAVPANLDPKFLAQAIAEAQAQREAAQQPQPQPAKPLTRADFLEPGDVEAIKKFESEWPDESQAIQKMFQAELRAALGNSFGDYTKQLNGVLAPLFGSIQKVEVNTYRGAVEAAHPDAYTIAPAVAAWIDTQPAFVREAYKRAYSGNNAQEAIELLTLYKTATGSTGAAPATPASSAAQETPTVAPVAVTKPAPSPKAVQALAAVPAAQRPKPSGGADVLDFDSAFAEAAETLGNS